jgi:importin subunit alpha-2
VRFLDEPALLDSPVLDDTLWMLINVAAGTPEQTNVVSRSGAVRPLVRLLANATAYSHAHLAAWALANIARDLPHEVLREGALPPLLALATMYLFMHAPGPHATDAPCACPRCSDKLRTEMLQVLAFALRQLCQGIPRPPLPLVRPALDVLVLLAEHCRDEDVLVSVGWALESFVASLRGEPLGSTLSLDAALGAGALPVLLDLAVHSHTDVSHAALAGLLHVARAGQQHATALVADGALPRLARCLTRDRTSCMLACDVLASVVSQGHVQALIDHGLFPMLFSIIHATATTAVNAHVAYVVWRACLAADVGACLLFGLHALLRVLD